VDVSAKVGVEVLELVRVLAQHLRPYLSYALPVMSDGVPGLEKKKKKNRGIVTSALRMLRLATQ
jgi:hypothetical protein